MRHRFYTTSTSALAAMLLAIEGARESIALEMYIFEHDTTGTDFLHALEKKASQGVRVTVILDAFGSFGVPGAKIERLRKTGAEVLFFSAFFRRTHRKILVVDESVVFLGGVNISGRFALWKDLQVRVCGKTVARSALRSFARMYALCGGKDPGIIAYRKSTVLRKTRLWFQEHGMHATHQSLRRHYEEHIDHAKSAIILVTPYLTPRRWLIARLHTAILRGVQVTIIVPKETDHSFVDRANKHFLSLFAELGASCFVGKGMNHAKVMLIDGHEGTVGSQNLDALSFERNVESSIFFHDPKMIRDLSGIIATWEREALPFTPQQDGHPLFDIVLRSVLRIFGSIL